ncbi:L,D-transpeptidase [Mariniflexile sp.]|uniref:L,D-transpeptidase n=1 Tax=Mariniflexile sp. TaxID=1979402 RepID=UPI0035677523
MLTKLHHFICSLLLLFVIKSFFGIGHQNNLKVLSFTSLKIELNHNYELNPIVIEKEVTIAHYFQFIDSLVKQYNPVTAYELTEHLLVRANPWIIDTLKNTDYYIMKDKGRFVYNQKELVVLHKGDVIRIPDLELANRINESFANTTIDINIPEYKLRIYDDSLMLYEFLVRVGRDEKKYLKMAGRTIDLKTKTGKGTIVRLIRNPDYYNPVNGKRYYVTRRDDNQVTKLPQVPFLETEINGLRNGQLIHPTTNPNTLGKAYSNGCIGTNEADAWVIYYHAPIGTKINIRYDLNVVNDNHENVVLKDIYSKY